MNSKRPIAYIAIIVIFLSPFVTLVKVRGNVARVEVAVVGERAISSTVLASGTFLYLNQVRVSPEVLGVVDQVLVSEGQTVAAGTPLVRIRADTFESDVAQRLAALEAERAGKVRQQADLANNEIKLTRLENLNSKGFATKAALDDAREFVESGRASVLASSANVQQAAALLRLAEQNLRKTLISSPKSGQVVEITTHAGETVVPSSVNLPGSSLLTIADTSEVIVEINVDEADVGRVKSGELVDLTPTAYPERKIIGTVMSVALSPGRRDVRDLGLPDAQPSQARTFSVRVQVPAQHDLSLRAGMTCRAEIHWQSTEAATSVPVEAIRTLENSARHSLDEAVVYIERNGIVERRAVQIGASDDQYQAVLSGVAAGEHVITGPAKTLYALQDGQRVKAGTASP